MLLLSSGWVKLKNDHLFIYLLLLLYFIDLFIYCYYFLWFNFSFTQTTNESLATLLNNNTTTLASAAATAAGGGPGAGIDGRQAKALEDRVHRDAPAARCRPVVPATTMRADTSLPPPSA